MSKLSSFKVISEVYKVVNGHEISLDICIPNDLPPGRHPLIIRIHGGVLITGGRIFEEYFPNWLIDYALVQSAIIVSPDYRLLPESKGVDILDDLKDLWSWIHSDLPAKITASTASSSQVDLERIVVSGESAGGYLSIQFALSHASELRAAIAAYPMLDLKSPFWTAHFEKLFFGDPGPMLPASVIDEHLATMKPGETVTEDPGRKRVDLCFATIQHGRLIEMLGEERVLFPEERIQDGEVLPPLFIFHGAEDTVVPVEGSEKFVEIAKGRGFDVHFVKMPGEHGFADSMRLSEGWMKEGMDFITAALMK